MYDKIFYSNITVIKTYQYMFSRLFYSQLLITNGKKNYLTNIFFYNKKCNYIIITVIHLMLLFK